MDDASLYWRERARDCLRVAGHSTPEMAEQLKKLATAYAAAIDYSSIAEVAAATAPAKPEPTKAVRSAKRLSRSARTKFSPLLQSAGQPLAYWATTAGS
jgi:hypothetical protein